MKLYDIDPKLNMTLLEAYDKGFALEHHRKLSGGGVAIDRPAKKEDDPCKAPMYVDLINLFLLSDGWKLGKIADDSDVLFCGVKIEREVMKNKDTGGSQIVLFYWTFTETQKAEYWLHSYLNFAEAIETLAEDYDMWRNNNEWKVVKWKTN